MEMLDQIETILPKIFPFIFGGISLIVLISFLLKSKHWKNLEKNYPLNPNGSIKKLGPINRLRFDYLPYKNMFGIGLNSNGLVIYPLHINKLTHKTVLIPFKEINEIKIEDYKINFIKYKQLIIKAKDNLTLITSTPIANNIKEEFDKKRHTTHR